MEEATTHPGQRSDEHLDEPYLSLLQDACSVGLELLRESFAKEIEVNEGEVKRCIETALKIVCNDQELFEGDGRTALEALAERWTGENGRRGARAWARLIEPFLHRLDEVVGNDGRAGRNLADLLSAHGLLDSRPVSAQREIWIAEHRRLASLLAAAPTATDTAALRRRLADRAGCARNRASHGIFPATISLREQLEIVEAVLTTMVAAVAKQEVQTIERGLLYRELRSNGATQQTVSSEKNPPDWKGWRVSVSTALAGRPVEEEGISPPRCLDHLVEAKLSVITGSRGVGRTWLASRLYRRLMKGYGPKSRCPILIDLSRVSWKPLEGVAPRSLPVQLIRSVFPFCGNRQGLEAELERGFYHLIVDGLEAYPQSDAVKVLRAIESAWYYYSDLALTLTYPNEVDLRHLGLLGKGSVFALKGLEDKTVARELARPRDANEQEVLLYLDGNPEVRDLLALPRFLHLFRRAGTNAQPLPRGRFGVVAHIVNGLFAEDAPPLWENIPPGDRRTASVLARAGLYGIASTLAEQPSGELSDPQSKRALEVGVQSILPDARLPEGLLAEIRERIEFVGMLSGGQGDRGFRLVHPEIEEHCGQEEFLKDTLRAWRMLGDEREDSWPNLLAQFAEYTQQGGPTE